MIQTGTGRINGFSDEQISSDKNPVEYTAEEKEVIEMVNWAMQEAENRVTKKITHKWFDENSPVQQYVQYAYEIGWMDLVTTIECENGTWSMYRQSDVIRNWKREESYWFCQVHRPDHKEIVDNPLFRSDYKWQLDRCAELLKWWTIFYWRNTRKIKWVACPKYVESRFILTDK